MGTRNKSQFNSTNQAARRVLKGQMLCLKVPNVQRLDVHSNLKALIRIVSHMGRQNELKKAASYPGDIKAMLMKGFLPQWEMTLDDF